MTSANPRFTRRASARRPLAWALLDSEPMLKLTRLNHHVVAINPDHIGWAEASPDTTLSLLNGEKVIVRESLDELIDLVLRYRRAVRAQDPASVTFPTVEGDPPRAVPPRKTSEYPRRPSVAPTTGGR